MSGQLIVSVGSFNGGIETNCLSAIQLRSSVPRDKRNKKKRKVEKRWRCSRIAHKPVFFRETQTLWEVELGLGPKQPTRNLPELWVFCMSLTRLLN